MSVRSNPAPAGVNPPMIIGAIALLLILIIGLAWHFMASPGGSKAHSLTAQQSADRAWMQQKATESGGDIRKLSADDQRRVYSVDGPRAAFDLRQLAHPAQVGQ